MSKPKISAAVSQEEFDAYQTEAARLGLSFSEWIRRACNSAVPMAAGPSVADAAFDQQDSFGKVAPMQPVVSKPRDVLPNVVPSPEAHPCMLLSPERPTNLSAGECSGTCRAMSQNGKPCFFNAMTARRCSLFASRTIPPPPIQGMSSRK